MTKQEIIQHKKNTALNAIRKLYNPQTKHGYTFYEGEGSAMEQMSFDVKVIIETLEEELIELKQKNEDVKVEKIYIYNEGDGGLP